MASLPSTPALDGVWRASELGSTAFNTVSSGHAALDAALPGEGWPRGQLTEVLQHQVGLHEWRLLRYGLQHCLGTANPVPTGQTSASLVVLVGSPHAVNTSALACQGIPSPSMVVIDVAQPSERLWVAEQALRCRDVAVLLLWAPKALPEQLRRLQVAAQALGGRRLSPLVFVFRPAMAAHESSPAPLRIGLTLARAGLRGTSGAVAHVAGRLAVQVIKRRGPVLTEPVLLDMDLPPALRHRHPHPRELTDHLQHLQVKSPSTLPHVVDRLHPFTVDPLLSAAHHLAA